MEKMLAETVPIKTRFVLISAFEHYVCSVHLRMGMASSLTWKSLTFNQNLFDTFHGINANCQKGIALLNLNS